MLSLRQPKETAPKHNLSPSLIHTTTIHRPHPNSKLLRDTYSYSLLLGPGNGTAAAPAATAAALLSKLVPERAALRALLIGVATDMESNAEYNKALRIFLSEGVEERALALVNKARVMDRYKRHFFANVFTFFLFRAFFL